MAVTGNTEQTLELQRPAKRGPMPSSMSIFYSSPHDSLSGLLRHGLAGWGLFVPWLLHPAPLYLDCLSLSIAHTQRSTECLQIVP